MKIKCKYCGNEQDYKPKSNKIAARPKTQCKNPECKKWIYINRLELIKSLTKNDQINDQETDQIDDFFHEYDQEIKGPGSNNDQIIDQKVSWPEDPDDQNDQKITLPGILNDQINDQKIFPDQDPDDQKTENTMLEVSQNRLGNGLDYRVLLTAVNNYLSGYRRAYENSMSKPYSEVQLKYKEMLEQKTLLEALLK